jgi:ribosomal-protein-alanine N-acetyltransferase
MLQEGKIILRAPKEADQKSLANLANNKKVSANLRDFFPFPYSEKEAAIFINLTKKEVPQTTFAIIYQDVFCGIISLVQQKDIYKKSAEIGYWLGEPFWNKGIITVCVKLITHYGLNQLELIRIYAGVFACNSGSMRVLEKNGYVKEGIFKDAIFKNGVVIHNQLLLC